jgi:hypothetical protein
MSVEGILKAKFPGDVVDALLSAYKEIEGNFATRKWKASELDAGHFVEAARRIIEHELDGSHTPIGKKLSDFSDPELKRYEQKTGDESYRMLIPRVLKSVFNIRNKRGVGHLGSISANEMDATYIIYSTKWVLAELVRLASGLKPEETQASIDAIVERRLSVLWKHDGIARVLASGLTTREQVLILLYDESPQTEEKLQQSVEYKNTSNFRKILRRLHKERLVEFQVGGQTQISPKGLLSAEEIWLAAENLGGSHKGKRPR